MTMLGPLVLVKFTIVLSGTIWPLALATLIRARFSGFALNSGSAIIVTCQNLPKALKLFIKTEPMREFIALLTSCILIWRALTFERSISAKS